MWDITHNCTSTVNSTHMSSYLDLQLNPPRATLGSTGPPKAPRQGIVMSLKNESIRPVGSLGGKNKKIKPVTSPLCEIKLEPTLCNSRYDRSC